MQARPVILPTRMIISVAVLCVAPLVLHACGARFAEAEESRSVALHTILEWTGVCVALVTVYFSFVQFSLRGDPSTPIIAAAMFCAGMLDAFHTLAVDGLIQTTADRADFVPFTWAISRIVNAVLLVGGASLFLRRPVPGIVRDARRNQRFVFLVSILFAIIAYAIIHVCAVAPRLPRAVYPESLVPRPWDAVSLVLFLAGGAIVLPRFYRVHPSLFSHGLLLSMVPQIAAQAHAAFGSTSMFDANANIASFLKIIAYGTPFLGMTLDYRRAYRAESSLRSAEEKLRIAREVQQGLLPRNAPELAGFNLAGTSTPADVMGGDWFDYVPLRDGCWGLVVADVSGHDVGASALMAQTRAYLRAVLRENDEPGRLLTETNRFVTEDVRDTRFVTLFFGKLDPRTRRLAFAAAGHNAWLLEGGDATRELSPTGPAVGMIPGATIASGSETYLAPSSILVIATDGICEAESLGGVPFGVDRLLDCVRANRSHPACEIVSRVVTAVREHTGSGHQADDLTVVVLKG